MGYGTMQAILDSMILMHYDNGRDQAIEWWEKQVEDGWQFYISIISVMERLKGVARISGSRGVVLKSFEVRLRTLKRERKIFGILPITKRISRRAQDLLVEYCRERTPPLDRSNMEALICDMLIAATALDKGFRLFTYNTIDFEWIRGLTYEKPDYEVEGL